MKVGRASGPIRMRRASAVSSHGGRSEALDGETSARRGRTIALDSRDRGERRRGASSDRATGREERGLPHGGVSPHRMAWPGRGRPGNSHGGQRAPNDVVCHPDACTRAATRLLTRSELREPVRRRSIISDAGYPCERKHLSTTCHIRRWPFLHGERRRSHSRRAPDSESLAPRPGRCRPGRARRGPGTACSPLTDRPPLTYFRRP